MCSIPSCEDPNHYSKGFCRYHYERQRKGLSLPGPRRTWNHGGRQCAHDNCPYKAKARGMCELHYKRTRAGLPLDMALRAVPKVPCRYVGCDALAGPSELCPLHLKRVLARTHGASRRAAKHAAFVEHVDIAVLRQRAHDMCGLCDGYVDPILQWPDPRSQSIDHIVPLSRGGEHSYRNTQLAHVSCNAKKQDRITPIRKGASK